MIRYIVWANNRGPYSLSNRWSMLKELKIKNILCYGRHAAAFKSHKAAQAALDRTKKYAAARDLPWTWLNNSFIKIVEIDGGV